LSELSTNEVGALSDIKCHGGSYCLKFGGIKRAH